MFHLPHGHRFDAKQQGSKNRHPTATGTGVGLGVLLQTLRTANVSGLSYASCEYFDLDQSHSQEYYRYPGVDRYHPRRIFLPPGAPVFNDWRSFHLHRWVPRISVAVRASASSSSEESTCGTWPPSLEATVPLPTLSRVQLSGKRSCLSSQHAIQVITCRMVTCISGRVRRRRALPSCGVPRSELVRCVARWHLPCGPPPWTSPRTCEAPQFT